MQPHRRYTLNASCPDRVGIVAKVAGFFAEHQGWILENANHSDSSAGRYFMRVEIRADSIPFHLAELRARFKPIADELAMSWRIVDSAVKKRMVIMVSKQDHCLYDLLSRWKSGELEVEIPCVISNHDSLRGFVEWHGITFHHVPVKADDKSAAFAEIERIIDEVRADFIVLARYMQILPPNLCSLLPERILNIHHSFLPSFVGAKPYHQAYARGVKLIGATCHYVTAELDAGPIIEQDVIRIDHSDSVEDMVRYGRDIEKAVLARGVRYHMEDRVLVHGNKTVVFR
ncbi:MAG: formyltetrahydrofolate deformylase [Rhodocyclaceae bacterium]|nr:formyltetrahydrofolate deformylase [Rhodocyclaceae bacterium]MBX3669971.1 formyltetrahydrofolate deformylase [Rhodocyclaceae bacterium]